MNQIRSVSNTFIAPKSVKKAVTNFSSKSGDYESRLGEQKAF